MPKFELTARAHADLDEISDYTQDNWGDPQAVKYIDSLFGFFALLAEHPDQGRPQSKRPGLYRMEYEKHVVFYRKALDSSIRISRVLHQSRLPDQVRFPR